MGTMHVKIAQMRRTAHVRPICFSVKEEAACKQLPCVMILNRTAVTEKMRSTAVSCLILSLALSFISHCLARKKNKNKSITNKQQQQLLIILKNVLAESCERLVLVIETKTDLDEDTLIEEKGRQLSAAIIGLTVNKTLGYNALMLLAVDKL